MQLLINHGGDVNQVNFDGMSALLHAANRGHIDVVRLLVNQKECKLYHSAHIPGNDNTALTYAARRGDKAMVLLLIDNHGDINHVADGYTALMRAVSGGHADVVKLLISRECNVNHAHSTGKTALSLAKEIGICFCF